MGRPDGAHTHGSRRWDWRIAALVAVIGLCATTGGRNFLFGGLEGALIWLAVVLTAATAVTALVVWRIMRRNSRAAARSIAARDAGARMLAREERLRAVFDDYARDAGANKALLSAYHGYPGHEGGLYGYHTRPELIRPVTITGRYPTGPEQAGRGHTTWPQRRDQGWTAEVIPDTDAVTGRPYDIYPDPGHE